MKLGTRSLVFGVHQVVLHGFIVLWAWKRLYGSWPKFWQVISIFIHDIGYLGSKNMDGDEGALHPYLGAMLASKLFGKEAERFVLYHSRKVAEAHGEEISPLCAADKLAFVLYPKWLYIFLGRLSGEIEEYKRRMEMEKCSDSEWFERTAELAREWAKVSLPPELASRVDTEFAPRRCRVGQGIRCPSGRCGGRSSEGPSASRHRALARLAKKIRTVLSVPGAGVAVAAVTSLAIVGSLTM